MSVLDIKLAVLLTLKELERATADRVAKKMGVWTSLTRWVLKDLMARGYVQESEDGEFSLSEKGVDVITAPKLAFTKEEAIKILAEVPEDKAFKFSDKEGSLTGVVAISLKDLCDKLREVELESVDYHMHQGHFTRWVAEVLGDGDLAKKIGDIGELEASLGEMRDRLCDLIKERYELLRSLA